MSGKRPPPPRNVVDRLHDRIFYGGDSFAPGELERDLDQAVASTHGLASLQREVELPHERSNRRRRERYARRLGERAAKK